jgi:hypothetical protein
MANHVFRGNLQFQDSVRFLKECQPVMRIISRPARRPYSPVGDNPNPRAAAK